jgi:hypothetical protein
MLKIGVLYSDFVESERYHILKEGSIIRDVLVHDRKADSEVYKILHSWMLKVGIDVLWIMPDTQLSLWLQRSDFDLIQGLDTFTPAKMDKQHNRPVGLRLGNRYIMFPAYMRTTKETGNSGQWSIPGKDILYDSVNYFQDSIGEPFIWGAGYVGMTKLRRLTSGKDIQPFHGGKIWDSALPHMVLRPSWRHRRDDYTLGLDEDQAQKKYLWGFDKNNQYLGACIGLELGNGECEEVDASVFEGFKGIGVWKYEIVDVSKSIFNSYNCYCPLSVHYDWASTELLQFCAKVGIDFRIKGGIIWKKRAGRALQQWAIDIRDAIQSLQDEKKYPSYMAAHNAKGTHKLTYIESMGRLCNEYSKELFHRDWNMRVIQNAIIHQAETIFKRWKEHHILPVLVSNDSFYVLSDKDTVEEAYPGILEHSHELRGYRCIGKCRMTEELVDWFADKNIDNLKLEGFIKQKMEACYATNAIR